MPEAWQFREVQRQTLLDGLMRKTFEREQSKSFLLNLAVVVLTHLRNYLRNGYRVGVGGILEKEQFFFNKIVLEDIRSFSRTEAETNFLVAEFLKKILNSGLQPFYRELMSQEISDPEKIYGVSSATAEVSLAEDDSE